MGITGFWEYGFGFFGLDIRPPRWRNGSINLWGKVSSSWGGGAVYILAALLVPDARLPNRAL